MKGSGCGDAFVAWAACVEAACKDGVTDDTAERCAGAASNLNKCMAMETHAEYYAPVLRGNDDAMGGKEAEPSLSGR
ncbi:hypothetical protein ACP70R_015284 [Stipagrostis hirtigluma subsp. patula]